MDLTEQELMDLLGAWAVDALEIDLLERIDEILVARPDLAAHADVLRNAAAALGDTVALSPPPAARTELLARATANRPGSAEGATPAQAYGNQVDALDALLGELEGGDWHGTADPYQWSAHGLLGHLLVIERYTAARMDPTAEGPVEAEHLSIGADEIAAELVRDPAATRADWLARARANVALAATVPDSTQVTFHGWPMSVASMLTIRAFEIWTHADDIRRATGLPMVDPAAEDLRTMSSFSVRTLPMLVPMVAPGLELGGAKVVLTGAGGGVHRIGDEDNIEVTLVADVVDYCRLAARRIAPTELDCTIEGDEDGGRALLHAAQVFAV